MGIEPASIYRRERAVLPVSIVATTRSAAGETGRWVDADLSGYPDAGEFVSYTVVVNNTGTVTLKNVEVTDTSGVASCTRSQPVASLGVGGSYECTASLQVRHSHA